MTKEEDPQQIPSPTTRTRGKTNERSPSLKQTQGGMEKKVVAKKGSVVREDQDVYKLPLTRTAGRGQRSNRRKGPNVSRGGRKRVYVKKQDDYGDDGDEEELEQDDEDGDPNYQYSKMDKSLNKKVYNEEVTQSVTKKRKLSSNQKQKRIKGGSKMKKIKRTRGSKWEEKETNKLVHGLQLHPMVLKHKFRRNTAGKDAKNKAWKKISGD